MVVAQVVGGVVPARIVGVEETRFQDWPVPVPQVCTPAVEEVKEDVIPAPGVDEEEVDSE